MVNQRHFLLILFLLIFSNAFSHPVNTRNKISKEIFTVINFKEIIKVNPNISNIAPGHLTGKVLDSATKTTVPYATISLFLSGSTKPLDAGLTDIDGKFSINKPRPGVYDLEISFIGYKTRKIKSITIDGGSNDLILGVYYLRSSATKLNEVKVVSQRSLIEQKVDRLVYNAGNDITNKGGDATDVLRKVPLLSVDLDGNVSLRGSQNLKVLINGKTSTLTANGVADAMKQIPSDLIQSVEVLTSPPAKYDAEGSGGVINIILKKNNTRGLFLNIDAAPGLRGTNLGLNGNYRSGKMTFSLGGFGRASYNIHGSFLNDQKLFSNRNGILDTIHTIQTASTRNSFLFGRYNLGWDYDIDSLNSLNASVQVGKRNNHVYQDNFYTLLYQGISLTPMDSSLQNTNVTNNSTQIDASLNYTHAFKKPREEFGLAGQFSHSNLNYNSLNDSIVLPVHIPGNSLQNINSSINQEITLQIDYQFPINATGLVEIGAKDIIRTATSNYTTEIAPGGSTNYQPYTLGFRNNDFSYNQNVTAGYLSLNQTFAKHYTLLLGGRYEYTTINANFTLGNSLNIPSYGILVPSLNFIDRFKDGSAIKIGFNRRIQRPSIQFLNPNIQASNPLNISVGNPNLKPEFTNNYELGYSTFVKGISLNLSSFIRATSGAIQSIRDVLGTDTLRTSYQNIGSETAYGFNASIGINLGSRLNINGGTDVFYDVLKNNDPLPQYNASNQGWVANFRLFGGYNFDKGWGLQFFTFYRGTVVQLQGTQGGFYVYSLAVKKEFLNKKGSIGIGADNFFTPSFKQSTIQNSAFLNQNLTNTLHNTNIKLTFSYRIGKMIAAKKKIVPIGINNDDLKDNGGGDQGGGGQGGNGQGGGKTQGGQSYPGQGGKGNLSGNGYPGKGGSGKPGKADSSQKGYYLNRGGLSGAKKDSIGKSISGDSTLKKNQLNLIKPADSIIPKTNRLDSVPVKPKTGKINKTNKIPHSENYLIQFTGNYSKVSTSNPIIIFKNLEILKFKNSLIFLSPFLNLNIC